MSIQDFTNKFKGYLEDEVIYTGILLFLVAVSAFGLGRRSMGEEAHVMSVEADNTEVYVAPNTKISKNKADEGGTDTDVTTTYVASKNSNKYHLPWCSVAKRISEANKITFSSKEEAKAAGYQPAANCPGI